MKLKQLPQDFIVKEIVSKKPIGEGEYTWFTLKKKNWELFKVLDLIADKCKVPRNRFSYVGLKDKNATTYQTISAWKVSEQTLSEIQIKDVELSDFDKNNRRIKIEDLKGNRFEIVVRDLSKKDIKGLDKKIRKLKKGTVNFFDSQRFGLNQNNHLIGKYLVKKDFKAAVSLFLKNNEQWESAVKSRLSEKKDYKSSLECLPKKFKMLFVNSYQSYLWNSLAKAYDTNSSGNSSKLKIPIIGYATQLDNYPKIKKNIEKLLKKEGIKLEDFKNVFEKASFPGDERDFLIYPKKISWKVEEDELSRNKKKLTICFELPKGSYGTYIIKSLF